MGDYYPSRDKDLTEDTPDLKLRRITITQKIKGVLARHGTSWTSLDQIQQIVRGSSVRSRLQDIMKADRILGPGRVYEERVTTPPKGMGKAPFKEYREAHREGGQDALFDVPQKAVIDPLDPGVK